MGDDDRRPLSAKLTTEAFQGWEDFAYANRVSVVALLEAIGVRLAREPDLWTDKVSLDTVAAARRITEERRSRRRS